MGQDLVDDDLEDQRRRQGEDLNEQGRREHVAERPAVTPDGRQEPTHAERFRVDAGSADATGDKQRLSAALAGKLLERNLHRPMADRVDEPAKAGRDATRVDAKPAASEPDDRRSRHPAHPLGVCASDQTGPQANLLRGAYEIEFVGFAAPSASSR